MRKNINYFISKQNKQDKELTKEFFNLAISPVLKKDIQKYNIFGLLLLQTNNTLSLEVNYNSCVLEIKNSSYFEYELQYVAP